MVSTVELSKRWRFDQCTLDLHERRMEKVSKLRAFSKYYPTFRSKRAEMAADRMCSCWPTYSELSSHSALYALLSYVCGMSASRTGYSIEGRAWTMLISHRIYRDATGHTKRWPTRCKQVGLGLVSRLVWSFDTTAIAEHKDPVAIGR